MKILYGQDYEYMCNQLSDLEDMWYKLFNFLNDYALAISPVDYEEGCEKCQRQVIYEDLQDIMNYMLKMGEEFDEKRK